MALLFGTCPARVHRYLTVGLAALCMSGIAWGSGRWLKMSNGLDGGRVNFLAINPVDLMTVLRGRFRRQPFSQPGWRRQLEPDPEGAARHRHQ